MTTQAGRMLTARTSAVWLVAALLAVVVVGTQLPGLAQMAGDDPLETVAFIARADNPVDALSASSVAGAMGGVVLLTGSNSLDDATRAALVELDPDLVVLAGGEAALSSAVEDAIKAIPLPTRRVSGPNRIDTSAALSAIAAEFGFGRPLLTGKTVEGDAGLSGTMSVGDLAVSSDVQVPNLNASLLEGSAAADFLGADEQAVDSARIEGQSVAALRHTSAAGNIQSGCTFIDHPLLNDNPDVLLSVTHVYDSGYIGEPLGVFFATSGTFEGRWCIFKEDASAMGSGRVFHVIAVDAPGAGAAGAGAAAASTPAGPGPGGS